MLLEQLVAATATASANVTGTASGQTFTTTAIASGTYGSGEITSCNTAGGNRLSFLPVFPGSTGTVGGPAPGGHSTGNATTWPMTYDNNNDGTLTGGLDDGSTPHATFTGTVAASSNNLTVSGVTHTISTGMWLFGPTNALLGTITGGSGTSWTVSFTAGGGGVGPEAMTAVVPGNVLTVSDTAVKLGPAGTLGSLDLGVGISLDGARSITGILTGTGTVGTYSVNGSAGAVLASTANTIVAPNGIFPGELGCWKYIHLHGYGCCGAAILRLVVPSGRDCGPVH